MTARRSDAGDGSVRREWQPLTRDIIGAFFEVYNALGYGLLESMYVRALAILLRERGLFVQLESALDVVFHEQTIGTYRADMVVEHSVVVELKAGAFLPPGSKAQLINYLRLSGLEVGHLMWFGPIPEFQRVVLSRKGNDAQ